MQSDISIGYRGFMLGYLHKEAETGLEELGDLGKTVAPSALAGAGAAAAGSAAVDLVQQARGKGKGINKTRAALAAILLGAPLGAVGKLVHQGGLPAIPSAMGTVARGIGALGSRIAGRGKPEGNPPSLTPGPPPP
jgi:hypothetical protein